MTGVSRSAIHSKERLGREFSKSQPIVKLRMLRNLETGGSDGMRNSVVQKVGSSSFVAVILLLAVLAVEG